MAFTSEQHPPDATTTALDRRPAKMLEVAAATGVAASTAWRWLTGLSSPSPLARQKLAEVGIVLEIRRPKKRGRSRR